MYDTDERRTHLNSLWVLFVCVCVCWGGMGGRKGVFPYGALCGLLLVGLCSTCVLGDSAKLVC